jgi:hypothetical protein
MLARFSEEVQIERDKFVAGMFAKLERSQAATWRKNCRAQAFR